jgi:hypothetical protein
LPFWHVTRGLGSYDVFAIGMARSVREIDGYVTAVDEMACVETAGYIVVTDRVSDLDHSSWRAARHLPRVPPSAGRRADSPE